VRSPTRSVRSQIAQMRTAVTACGVMRMKAGL
jgi:hypothetical protein